MNDRELAADLRASAVFEYPRFEDRFGRCRYCELPATVLLIWIGSVFGGCDACGCCWFAGHNLVKDPLPRLDAELEAQGMLPSERARILDDLQYESIHLFSRLQTVEPGQHVASAGVAHTMRKPTDAPGELDLAGRARMLEQQIATIEALLADRKPVSAEALAGGLAACVELRDAATREVFPYQLAPAPDPVLHDFDRAVSCSGLMPFESIVGFLVSLHDQSIDLYPDLAALIRGPRGQALVRLHARNAAAGDSVAWGTADANALATFVQLIVVQLQARGLCQPAAALLSDVVPRCERRLAAVAEQIQSIESARTAARQAAEARDQAEREAAADAIERVQRAEVLRTESREARNRREDLADFYKRYARFQFPIDGKTLTGEEAASQLLQGAPFLPFFRAQTRGERIRVKQLR